MNNFIKGSVLIGITLVALLILSFLSTTSISPGYAGVVYNRNGGLEDVTLGQGWHMVAPWKVVTEYPVSTETVYMSKVPHDGRKSDDSLWVNTKDGKTVNVDITYAYHMDQVKLSHIFAKFRGAPANSIEWGYLKNEVYRVSNEVSSQYSMMEMVSDKRTEVNTKIFNALRDVLEEDGIIVETLNLSRVEPDEQTLQSIQLIVNAQNAVKQAEQEKQKAQINAETQRIVARGNADSILIAAEGQAQANEKLQQSLTDNVIKSQWIAKWNGATPTTELSSGNALVSIGK